VTLRDIARTAAAVGIRHASLLFITCRRAARRVFVEVGRNFERHRATDFGDRDARPNESTTSAMLLLLTKAAIQPPMDLVRMNNSDMPAIDPVHAERWRIWQVMHCLTGAAVSAGAQRATRLPIAIWDSLRAGCPSAG